MCVRRVSAVPTVATVLCVLVPGTARTADDGVEFFEKKIRPALVEHCYPCHSAGAKEAKGGLRLDNPEAVRKGASPG